MSLKYYALTDKGKKRAINEDSYLVNEEEKLFCVADGMGGQAAGDVASKIAIKILEQFVLASGREKDITWPFEYNTTLSHFGNRLKAAIRLAHNEIVRTSFEKKEYQGMGTTVVACIISQGNATIAYVGDSRAYLIRDKKLTQLTKDHSWVREQVEMGLITDAEARTHPYRNVVTRALGGKMKVEIDVIEEKLEPGDHILLCTDGLNSMVDNEDILQVILDSEDDLSNVCNKLIEKANENGGEDNTTVIFLEYFD
jgi:serine/threonine protein phosphatase PrpC